MQTSQSILIVDDEPAVLEAYRDYLCPTPAVCVAVSSRRSKSPLRAPREVPSYRLLLAESGERAVELVEEEIRRGGRVAAGFFDMTMPGGIDGMETIRRVRQLDGAILCTVVTAYQDRSVHDINQLFVGGCEDEWDYLSKPFTQNEIQQKARSLIASWNRRHREETRLDDLELVVVGISEIRMFDGGDASTMIEHVLTRLVELTEGQGALAATFDDVLSVIAGVGDLASPNAAKEIINRRDVSESLVRCVESSRVEAIDGMTVFPCSCIHGMRAAVLLASGEIHEERRNLVRILIENASVAVENIKLYEELRESNVKLEDRVVARTEELTRANAELEERTRSLEDTIWTLKSTEAQLLHKEKLATVGVLSASVAHEVNNPASFILTNLEALQRLVGNATTLSKLIDDGSSADEIRDFQKRSGFCRQLRLGPEMMNDCIEGMLQIVSLVRDLKRYARHDDDEEAVPVCVEQLVDDTLRILDHQLKHRATVHRRYGRTSPVLVNKGRLSQVFLNLVTNAMDAVDAAESSDRSIFVETTELDGSVSVSVKDTGPGVAEERLEEIFVPFYTTKQAGAGTGLGLSIAKNIVERHGGRIHAHSRLGEGATFTVTLPAAGRSLAALTASLPSSVPQQERGVPRLRILLIDDDPHVLRAHQRQMAGIHEVAAAASGYDALELLGADDEYDAVVCDLMMPRMTGVALYDQVCRRHPALKNRFVFITGGGFSPEVEDFVTKRRPRVLQKPVLSHQLDECLRTLAVVG